MAEPARSHRSRCATCIRRLRARTPAWCARWTASASTCMPGRTLGVVGESGCGKSVTARSILRIVDRPGRIVRASVLLDPGAAQQQDLAALDPEGNAMRAMRGGEIGAGLPGADEPRSACTTRSATRSSRRSALHSGLSKAEARAARDRAAARGRHPAARAARRRLSVPAERRPAPAGRHRAGAGRRSAAS